MLYAFSCKKCNKRHDLSFPMSEFDQHVHTSADGELEGCHRTELCPKCGTKTLYRHISADTMPHAGGGTNNYKSMEKYWSENPGLQRKHEDQIMAKRAERHRQRVLDNIDKQPSRGKRSERGKGYKDDKLRFDE